MEVVSRYSRREKHSFYNSLAILLKAVEGERTLIDLRNEATIFGVIAEADGFMNVVMKECVFTDPRGSTFNYDLFFVQARNIRFVHIPAKIPIIRAIKEQLLQLSSRPSKLGTAKRTFKTKRTEEKQRVDLLAVEKLLIEKDEKKQES